MWEIGAYEARPHLSELLDRVARFLLALPVAVDPVDGSLAFTTTRRLARTRELTTYDAAYLELAVRMGLPPVTTDGGLREAAETEGVEIYGPG